jgi:hypothetical protein
LIKSESDPIERSACMQHLSVRQNGGFISLWSNYLVLFTVQLGLVTFVSFFFVKSVDNDVVKFLLWVNYKIEKFQQFWILIFDQNFLKKIYVI